MYPRRYALCQEELSELKLPWHRRQDPREEEIYTPLSWPCRFRYRNETLLGLRAKLRTFEVRSSATVWATEQDPSGCLLREDDHMTRKNFPRRSRLALNACKSTPARSRAGSYPPGMNDRVRALGVWGKAQQAPNYQVLVTREPA